MGTRLPVWQAALAGAVVGTLPDLDVFIDKGDAVRDMVLHRAETHALAYQALATPLIAAVAAALSRTRGLYLHWCLLVALGLFTHSLLDAMTVYGTRIGLPFTDQPFAVGSLFIIDPLYTLPLLVGVGAAVFAGRGRRLRWNTAGLVLSTLYAAWSVIAQVTVTQRVMQTSLASTLPASQILVTPAPFNTLLWRIVVVDGDSYYEAFHSLLDPLHEAYDGIHFARFTRGSELESKTRDFAAANLIRDFSQGFYALSDDGHIVRITDLRFGQAPYYAFAFGFAQHQSEPLREITPVRFSRRIPIDIGLAWLQRRMTGEPLPPPR